RAGATSIGELARLKHGQPIKIGGLLVAVQRPPTAKGFAFLAVEDASGLVNVIVAPLVYEQYRVSSGILWLSATRSVTMTY
ncbi:partial Error-prone DNA polymerase, partial [uncultured bacterium]